MSNDNGNMPAMPLNQPIDTHQSWGDLTGGGRFIPANGVTKREMMAMSADVSKELENMDNFMDMAYFIGEDFNHQMTLESKISLKFRVAAKLKAMAADALLKELSK